MNDHCNGGTVVHRSAFTGARKTSSAKTSNGFATNNFGQEGKPDERSVFISYSRKDKFWRRELETYKPFVVMARLALGQTDKLHPVQNGNRK